MHGSSLDPYTRLLASVADAVTKARQSFPKTLSGKLILLGILLCVISFVGAIVLLTSIFWGPILVATTMIYISATGLRLCIACTTASIRRLKDEGINVVTTVVGARRQTVHIVDDYVHQQRTEAAIKDQGFLRTIFEALPGVDPDSAIARVPKLSLFRLAMHEALQSTLSPRCTLRSPGHRGSDRMFSGDIRSHHARPGPEDKTDESSGISCVSPMQELFDKGLLDPVDTDWQLEEQASWQAGRPFVPLHHTLSHYKETVFVDTSGPPVADISDAPLCRPVARRI